MDLVQMHLTKEKAFFVSFFFLKHSRVSTFCIIEPILGGNCRSQNPQKFLNISCLLVSNVNNYCEKEIRQLQIFHTIVKGFKILMSCLHDGLCNIRELLEQSSEYMPFRTKNLKLPYFLFTVISFRGRRRGRNIFLKVHLRNSNLLHQVPVSSKRLVCIKPNTFSFDKELLGNQFMIGLKTTCRVFTYTHHSSYQPESK